MALRLGWLSWLVADGGVVRNALEALSWVAALAGIGFAVVELRKRREPAVAPSVHVGRALHLDGDRLPKVADVSLLALRVKRAVDTFDAEGRDLPRYVPRDRDEDLEWAIASGGLVLLHGRAAAGKSRAAAEAVRRLRPLHDLLVPVDGPALRKIAESGLTDTVVWLDDLERFLVPGGLDVSLLQRLAPAGSSVCVVATIRDHELADYRTADGVINKAAADLIASIPPSHLITIDQRLTEAEQEQARPLQADDPRIGRALEASEGFAEYLAAGTPMLERWSIGDSPLFYVGQALISAAVDCRRAGYVEAVPSTTLAELYRSYLPTPWCDRPDLPPVHEGLAWAARPVLGASSCLQPRTDGAFLVSDYLVDQAQEGDSPLGDSPIPDRTWETLFSLSSDRNVAELGAGAYRAGRFDVAERSFRRAFQAGDSMAGGLLAITIGKMGRFSEVRDMFREAAQSDDGSATLRVALGFSFNNKFDDVLELAKHAVEAGDGRALLSLTTFLADSGNPDLFQDLATFTIDNGETKALLVVLTTASKYLSPETLLDLVIRSIETGRREVVLVTLLATEPDPSRIPVLLEHATGRDIEAGVETVMEWFAGLGKFKGIAHALRDPLVPGRDRAISAVAAALQSEDSLTEFLVLTREAVDTGNIDDLRTFAEVLTHHEKQELLPALQQYAIDRGRTGSAALLANLADQNHEP
ncbi:hypothetical protein ILP97_26810 [Amycolatopsis sp. H6(2020)]|nr:hypothetical protein [Amycolatopsis sp. H6(2020)]